MAKKNNCNPNKTPVYVNRYDPCRPTYKEVVDPTDLVRPDEAFSIRDLLVKYTNDIPSSFFNPNPELYHDGVLDDIDLSKVQFMDLAERQELIQVNLAKMKRQQEIIDSIESQREEQPGEQKAATPTEPEGEKQA